MYDIGRSLTAAGQHQLVRISINRERRNGLAFWLQLRFTSVNRAADRSRLAGARYIGSRRSFVGSLNLSVGLSLADDGRSVVFWRLHDVAPTSLRFFCDSAATAVVVRSPLGRGGRSMAATRLLGLGERVESPRLSDRRTRSLSNCAAASIRLLWCDATLCQLQSPLYCEFHTADHADRTYF